MKHRANDYIVVRQGNKNVLALATGKTVGLVANTMHLPEPETIKFSPSVDLLCVLGKDPEPGSTVFGVTVRPYVGMPVITGIPSMHLYGRAEEVRKPCVKAVKRLPKLISKLQINEAMRRCVAINFVQQSGSKSHTFRTKFKKDEWHDEITIFVDRDCVVQDVYTKLLLAIGESVWTHLVSSKRKVRWLMLFDKLRNVQRYNHTTLTGLLEDFQQAGDARDVKNVVSEDLLPNIDTIFRIIARQRAVTVKDLELIAAQDSKAVEKLWPEEIQLAEGRPDLDKAVMKNVVTLFSHIFAKHVEGVDVGKTLRKAIKNSLKEVKGT